MIVGHGFVGSAVASLFSEKEKVIVDPKFTDTKLSDYPGICLLYTSPSPRDKRQSRMPSSA